jgi:hypothetical protein
VVVNRGELARRSAEREARRGDHVGRADFE